MLRELTFLLRLPQTAFKTTASITSNFHSKVTFFRYFSQTFVILLLIVNDASLGAFK
jgi:hypothetical protein